MDKVLDRAKGVTARGRLYLFCLITSIAVGIATNVLAQQTDPGGTPDLTFSDSTQQPGRVLTDFRQLPSPPFPPNTRSREQVFAIAIQADGKIVAAGVSDSPNGDPNFALVRYHPVPVPPPGSSIPISIDLTFSDSTQEPGRVITDFRQLPSPPFPPNTRSSDTINAIAIQADGKIVAAGVSNSPNGDPNFALARYHPVPVPPPGSSIPISIDLTFSDSTQEPGRVITDFQQLPNPPFPPNTRSSDAINAIAIQADGKIVAAGFSDSPNGDNNFALARYNANGVIDTTFGDGTQQPGRVVTDFRPIIAPDGTFIRRSNDLIQAIAIQADGKIVAAGISDSPNGDPNFALVRYNADGSIDTTFGDSKLDPGRVITDFQQLPNPPFPPNTRSTDVAFAIAIQTDGKIVVAGVSNSPNGDPNFALVRYNANGVIDTTFGDGTQQRGRVHSDFRQLPSPPFPPNTRSTDQAFAIAIQTDGKIVAAGVSNSPNGDDNFALVRYHGAPVIVRLSAATVVGGTALTGTVTLPTPAEKPLAIRLVSSQPGIVGVPDTLLQLPGAKTSVTFPVTTRPVAIDTNVEITVRVKDSFELVASGVDHDLAVIRTTLTVRR